MGGVPSALWGKGQTTLLAGDDSLFVNRLVCGNWGIQCGPKYCGDRIKGLYYRKHRSILCTAQHCHEIQTTPHICSGFCRRGFKPGGPFHAGDFSKFSGQPLYLGSVQRSIFWCLCGHCFGLLCNRAKFCQVAHTCFRVYLRSVHHAGCIRYRKGSRAINKDAGFDRQCCCIPLLRTGVWYQICGRYHRSAKIGLLADGKYDRTYLGCSRDSVGDAGDQCRNRFDKGVGSQRYGAGQGGSFCAGCKLSPYAGNNLFSGDAPYRDRSFFYWSCWFCRAGCALYYQNAVGKRLPI